MKIQLLTGVWEPGETDHFLHVKWHIISGRVPGENLKSTFQPEVSKHFQSMNTRILIHKTHTHLLMLIIIIFS